MQYPYNSFNDNNNPLSSLLQASLSCKKKILKAGMPDVLVRDGKKRKQRPRAHKQFSGFTEIAEAELEVQPSVDFNCAELHLNAQCCLGEREAESRSLTLHQSDPSDQQCISLFSVLRIQVGFRFKMVLC